MFLASLFKWTRRWGAVPGDCASRARDYQNLELPLPSAGATAVLTPGFRPARHIREFAADDVAGIQSFAPEVLVAPLETAKRLAAQQLSGPLVLPSLQLALIVLTRIDDAPLTPSDRDLLWRAFGVPLFEQLRDCDGTVIARECEVHDGLHLAEPAVPHAMIGRLGFELAVDHCECGAETPRLKWLEHEAPALSIDFQT